MDKWREPAPFTNLAPIPQHWTEVHTSPRRSASLKRKLSRKKHQKPIDPLSAYMHSQSSLVSHDSARTDRLEVRAEEPCGVLGDDADVLLIKSVEQASKHWSARRGSTLQVPPAARAAAHSLDLRRTRSSRSSSDDDLNVSESQTRLCLQRKDDQRHPPKSPLLDVPKRKSSRPSTADDAVRRPKPIRNPELRKSRSLSSLMPSFDSRLAHPWLEPLARKASAEARDLARPAPSPAHSSRTSAPFRFRDLLTFGRTAPSYLWKN